MPALIFKECKKLFLSIPYIILVVTLVIFASGQIWSDNSIEIKPDPTSGNYGTIAKDIPEIIMPTAVESLYNEFSINNYIAYPIGFYKNVKLSEKKQGKIAACLSQLTGISEETIIKKAGVTTNSSDDTVSQGISYEIGDGSELTQGEDGSYTFILPETDDTAGSKDTGVSAEPDNTEDVVDTENATDTIVSGNTSDSIATDSDNDSMDITYADESTITILSTITYDTFRSIMEQVDDIIGGGSNYDDLYLISNFGDVPLTYEEALANYNGIFITEKVTGAYARLFSDYICIMLGLLPVFLCVAEGLKDKRARMHELIYTRSTSSLKLILSRYLAILMVVMLPVLLLAAYGTYRTYTMYLKMTLDWFAFFKYSFGWLLPTLAFTSALGMFITKLTSSPVAILVQVLWWFNDTFLGMRQMKGGYGNLVLMPRHNALGNTQVYLDNFNTLMVNRLLYSALAVLFVLLTVLLYHSERRGRLYGLTDLISLLRHRKTQPTA